jgi:two-component system, OmpR family, response regulator
MTTKQEHSVPDILIVEDDPSISGLYTYILKKRGYLVHQARDVHEGLQVLESTKPNLLLLDLLMPGESGLDFLSQANLAKQYPGTKVIIVSNVDSQEFEEQLKPYRVERYLTKAEYTPHRVADVVEQALGVEAGQLRLGLLGRIISRLRW